MFCSLSDGRECELWWLRSSTIVTQLLQRDVLYLGAVVTHLRKKEEVMSTDRIMRTSRIFRNFFTVYKPKISSWSITKIYQCQKFLRYNRMWSFNFEIESRFFSSQKEYLRLFISRVLVSDVWRKVRATQGQNFEDFFLWGYSLLVNKANLVYSFS